MADLQRSVQIVARCAADMESSNLTANIPVVYRPYAVDGLVEDAMRGSRSEKVLGSVSTTKFGRLWTCSVHESMPQKDASEGSKQTSADGALSNKRARQGKTTRELLFSVGTSNAMMCTPEPSPPLLEHF